MESLAPPKDGVSRHDPQQTLVVLQATPFCNLDCSYCYLPHRSDKNRMSLDTLERIYRQVLASELLTEPICFVWHAGEPLAAPVSYYKDAFSLFERLNATAQRRCLLSLQTNATLINEAWVELFKAHRVVVGVSIDGPAFIHDRQRLTRSGGGTHEAAMLGLRRLLDAGVPTSVIMVLTDFALDFPDQVFQFFLESGVERVGFNIDEIEGIHTESSHGRAVDPAKYRKFMWRMLQLSEEAGGRLRIREFEDTFRSISLVRSDGTTGRVTCSTNQPLRILNFGHDGSFTTFCPELLGTKTERFGEFFMGNVHKESVDSLQDGDLFQRVNAEIQHGVNACKETCAYWNFCGGGAPGNKYFEHGRFDVTETLYCRLHKQTLVDVVLDYLESRVAAPVSA